VILAKEQGPDTVAVVMSAFDDSLLHKEATQCGAGYLAKPFTREEVLASLGNAAPTQAINI
jgi:YesN/AraC family two-component response regulator